MFDPEMSKALLWPLNTDFANYRAIGNGRAKGTQPFAMGLLWESWLFVAKRWNNAPPYTAKRFSSPYFVLTSASLDAKDGENCLGFLKLLLPLGCRIGSAESAVGGPSGVRAGLGQIRLGRWPGDGGGQQDPESAPHPKPKTRVSAPARRTRAFDEPRARFPMTPNEC